MRSILRHRGALAAASAILALFCAGAADAACNPGSCDAVFDCGTRECIGLTCETFFEDVGTLCRSAAGVCDAAESCSGSSLSCPSDKRKSASVVCRQATGPCDATEHCTGTAAACPADVGITPTIDSLEVLDRNISFGSGGTNHVLSVILDGADFCTTTFESQVAITSPVQLGNETPSSHLAVHLHLNASPLPSDTYSFAMNRGALAVAVPFVAGQPNAGVDITSPTDGATVGPHATATVDLGCSNCEVGRTWVSAGDPLEPIGPTAFFGHPFSQPFDVSLDSLTDAQEGLADGAYGLEAEVIDGVIANIPFVYLSGTSNLHAINFTVPEAGGPTSTWAAAAALAWCARTRGEGRRRL